ncbi:MAG: AraC family transcriptional regulator [Lachnospiraceae bacterium]
MGLQKCGLKLNHASKELQAHGTLDFPCAGYSEHYTNKPEDIIPWHWHEEMEIIYLKTGELQLHIPAKTYHLKEGDCIIINSNIFHYGVAAPQCELHSLVFNSALITGNDNSVFAKKFILPLISCPSFDWYLFKETDNSRVICDFIDAFAALACDAPGFEFIIRSKISDICFFLYQQFDQEIGTGNTVICHDSIRIKEMLKYIHDHFLDDLSLGEISSVVGIGERECLRCFQRTIQLSPMQYLLKYRIMQGAILLKNNPLHNISEISSSCGFNSPSNFSKLFKRFYNCTPRDYRNQKKM